MVAHIVAGDFPSAPLIVGKTLTLPPKPSNGRNEIWIIVGRLLARTHACHPS